MTPLFARIVVEWNQNKKKTNKTLTTTSQSVDCCSISRICYHISLTLYCTVLIMININKNNCSSNNDDDDGGGGGVTVLFEKVRVCSERVHACARTRALDSLSLSLSHTHTLLTYVRRCTHTHTHTHTHTCADHTRARARARTQNQMWTVIIWILFLLLFFLNKFLFRNCLRRGTVIIGFSQGNECRLPLGPEYESNPSAFSELLKWLLH